MTAVTQKMPGLRLPDLVTPLGGPSPSITVNGTGTRSKSTPCDQQTIQIVQQSNKKIKVIVVADLVSV